MTKQDIRAVWDRRLCERREAQERLRREVEAYLCRPNRVPVGARVLRETRNA